MEFKLDHIYLGDVLKVLRTLPSGSVHCIVTSPPYWGLRNYGMKGQIGMERSPAAYVRKLVTIFRECSRVLREDGTLWLNLGDTYYGGKGANGASQAFDGARKIFNRKALVATAPGSTRPNDLPQKGLKPKDMVGIPWMVAFALRNAGWYLRDAIIWHKPNPMPESVTDRCTKAYEHIFLLSKSRSYFFDADAIKMPATVELKNWADRKEEGAPARSGGSHNTPSLSRKSGNKARKDGIERGCPEDSGSNVCGSVPWEGAMANKRNVWTVATVPFKDAHFATFPEALITDCIKAGAPAGGIVLDPFMGAGTTALVAASLGRRFVGIELNPEYLAIAQRRLQKELGMFNPLQPHSLTDQSAA